MNPFLIIAMAAIIAAVIFIIAYHFLKKCFPALSHILAFTALIIALVAVSIATHSHLRL